MNHEGKQNILICKHAYYTELKHISLLHKEYFALALELTNNDINMKINFIILFK